MGRETWVFIEGKMIKKSADGVTTDAYHQAKANEKANKKYNSFVIGDAIELVAPFDGKTYTSKAKMRAEANARGLIEIGNENIDRVQSAKRREIYTDQRKQVRADIERALHNLKLK